jgi:hypothetical protein
MPQPGAGRRGTIYALIGVGFAGLIGAHEFAGTGDDADLTVPFILAAVGTLSFISAGVMAFRLLRGGGAPR